jgi:Ca-activated chloride channel family protein
MIDPKRQRQGTLATRDGRALPLERTRVEGVVRGPIADVTVKQRFANDTSEKIDAVYSFPLPDGAAVHTMEFHIGDRVVRAKVEEKAKAREAYERARAAGRTATLLEEDDPTLFTLSVANVPPGASVDVVLGYEQLLGFDDGEWRFVFPMVAPERYRALAPGESASAISRLRVPTGERPGDVELELLVHADASAIEKLRCTSHSVDVETLADGGRRIVLRQAETIANRDFALAFRASGEGVRPLVYTRRVAGERGTFLVVVTPPSDGLPRTAPRGGASDMKALTCGNCGGLVTDLSAIKDIPGIGPAVPCTYCCAILAPSTEGKITRATRPRDVVVIVDRSASMRGEALPQARRAVRALLDALPQNDAVQVLAFDHTRAAFDGDGAGLVALAPEVKDRIDAFLGKLEPRGGSELERALEAAAKIPVREGRTPVVVLVTDAAVGNEGRLVRRAAELLGNRRLFVLGVGATVDRRLVRRLARACSGASDVIGTREDVEPTVARFAKRVREGGPVLTGLSIAWDGAATAEVSPSRAPDLYGGEPVAIYGRFEGRGETTLVITGATADGRPFRQELALDLPAESDSAPRAIERLWARARIEELMERLERDPSEAADVEKSVTALALAHSLVSRYTSLIADDTMDDASDDADLDGSRRLQGASRARHEAHAHGGDYVEEAAEMEASTIMRSAPMGGAPPAPHAPAPLSATMASPPPPPGSYAPRPAARAASGVVGAVTKAGAVIGRFFAGDDDEGVELADSVAARPHGGGSQLPIEAPGSEPYPEDELRWLDGKVSGELDLVFLVDETGSMGPYIQQVQARLRELVTAVERSPLCKSLRIALVTYRDHAPQDHTYASKVVPFTADFAKIRRAVDAMVASGGGDGPESVTDGLFDVVRLEWRPSAARAVVWFGDAPPHGVDRSGDGFPEGCPCGNHWYTQAESLREMGIAVYAVGCLPNLSHYAGGVEVFRTVARATDGTYLPLHAADVLVPLIAGAAATQLDKQRVDARIAAIVEEHAEPLCATDEPERVRWLTEELRERNIRARAMRFDESSHAPPPVVFRDVLPAEVAASLERLRLGRRVMV